MFGLFGKRKAPTAVPNVAIATEDESLQLIVPMIKVMEPERPGTAVLNLPPDQSPMARPLAADLVVMYAIDHPDRFEYVTRKRMQTLGLTEEMLHKTALRNLPNRVPKIEVHGNSPCHMVTAGGNFEAALLLHEELWEKLGPTLPGEPIAVVPARDLLFVSGSEWPKARVFMQEVANTQLQDSRHALSKAILVLRGGCWAPYGFDS